MTGKSLIPIERIENSIFLIRGKKVMIDSDLASLYGTTTKRLNEQVRRNMERFPEDFMFQLTDIEFAQLKEVVAKFNGGVGRGGRRYPPYAFTEHGAIMAASLINTPIAIDVSIFVVRAFIRLRRLLESNAELAEKIDALEKKYDSQFKVIFDAIRELMKPEEPKKKQIGFHWQDEDPMTMRTRKGRDSPGPEELCDTFPEWNYD